MRAKLPIQLTDYQQSISLPFSGKEKDSESGYYYFGARYFMPSLSIWNSVDPMADKYPSLSPYNYCAWNPLKLVDPNGMDVYYFNEDGSYSHKTKSKGEHYGVITINNKQVKFTFADPINDPQSIDKKKISKINFMSDKSITDFLNAAGVYDMSKSTWKEKINYLLTESNASKENGSGKLDFVITAGEQGLNSNTLYLTMVDDVMVAHNDFNFGNFLWGASTAELGIPPIIATIGAHVNNFLNDSENVTLPLSQRKFDSKDDQLSIKLGIKWAKHRR